jgi:hypothetical protein
MFRRSPKNKTEELSFQNKKDNAEESMSNNDQFYFLPREPGMTSTVVDVGADGGELEAKPADTSEEEFEPKPVNRLVSI